MTMARQHSNSSHAAAEPISKEELWEGALEKDIGSGATVQMIGMDSTYHIVYARVVPSSSSSSSSSAAIAAADASEDKEAPPPPPPQVNVLTAVEAMVDEEWRHAVKNILERKAHIDNDSRPPARELLRLGAVWLVNETAYAQGGDAHAHRLGSKDADTVPDWTDMTLRVYYVPDRFHAANEVDWHKYCRGLLVGDNVEVSVGEEKPHVPMKALPDSKDGVIVYEDEKLGFAVLNKPEGVPGHGTKSNHLENVLHAFHEALKDLWPETHRKIHVTLPHQIDQEIQGLIAVSSRKEFAAYLTTARAAVARKYRVLVCIRDPESMDRIEHFLGTGTTIVHYVDPKCPSPRKKFVRNQPKSSGHEWTECRMRVTGIGFGEDNRLRAASVTSQYEDANEPDVTLAHRLWRPDSSANPAEDVGAKYVMQLEIEDLTGRPHQLRGQLASLGVPIVGDALYGGGVCVTGAHRHTWTRMALQCCEMSFMEPRVEEEKEGEGGEGGGAKGSTAMVPSERKCVFRLKEAWWTPYMEEYSRFI